MPPRKIGHKVAEHAKKRRVPATVIDAVGGKCAVKLGKRGKRYYGVPFFGGPVTVGQEVWVDMSSGRPVVEAYGTETDLAETPRQIVPRAVNSEPFIPSEHPGIMLSTGIELYTSGSYQVFAPDENGLNDAIANIDPGAIGSIVIPPCTLSGDFMFPSNTHVYGHSHRDTIFTGKLTFADEGSLIDCKVNRTITSGSDAEYCLEINGSGGSDVFWMDEVELKIDNSGTGQTACFAVDQSVYLEAQSCRFICDSSGSGYAAVTLHGGASAYMRDSYIDADNLSNDQYSVDVLNCQFVLVSWPAEKVTNSQTEQAGHYHEMQTLAHFTGALAEDYKIPTKVYNRSNEERRFIEGFVTIEVAPTGQSAIFDVKYGSSGSSIFASDSDRLIIAAGNYNDVTTNFDDNIWATGDYLEFYCVQAGSTVNGEDATIHLTYKVRTSGYLDRWLGGGIEE